MFLFKAKKVLKDLKKFSPEIIENCNKSLKNSNRDLEFQRLNKIDFEKCPNISFDIAVMEKTKDGVALPLKAGWSDSGSCKSVWENSKKDKANNITEGKNIFISDTKNSYIRSKEKIIVGVGLNDLVVIDTDDSLLISDKKQSQKVWKV